MTKDRSDHRYGPRAWTKSIHWNDNRPNTEIGKLRTASISGGKLCELRCERFKCVSIGGFHWSNRIQEQEPIDNESKLGAKSKERRINEYGDSLVWSDEKSKLFRTKRFTASIRLPLNNRFMFGFHKSLWLLDWKRTYSARYYSLMRSVDGRTWPALLLGVGVKRGIWVDQF